MAFLCSLWFWFIVDLFLTMVMRCDTNVLSRMISVLVMQYTRVLFSLICLLREGFISHDCRLVIPLHSTPHIGDLPGVNFVDLLCSVSFMVLGYNCFLLISCHLFINYQITPCVLHFADWANPVCRLSRLFHQFHRQNWHWGCTCSVQRWTIDHFICSGNVVYDAIEETPLRGQ